MRILAGGPARETSSDLYRLHRESLEAQGNGGPEKAGSGGSPSSVSSGFDVVVHHEVVEDVGGPRWHHDKIRRVAEARQRMMDKASSCPCTSSKWYAEGSGHLLSAWRPGARCRACEWTRTYDALLMVDTDVILGPGVLERMWQVDADVVYATFWTRDDWGQPATSDVAPQCWWTHPYDWRPTDAPAMTCWNALCEPGVNEVEVNGGGACTLIRGRGFESHYSPLLESLKGAGRLWPGEDRTYCLGLECRGIRQVAVTGLPVVHLYDRALQTPAKLAEARELVGLGHFGTSIMEEDNEMRREALAESLRS